MKKTFITTFIAILLLGAPAFAEKATILESDNKDTKDAPLETKKPKVETVLTKKQKAEAGLRSSARALSNVIERTSAFISILEKNGKDVAEADSLIKESEASLSSALELIDQLSENISPETRIAKEDKVATKVLKDKDLVKKIEDLLKEAKASLIKSINSLKQTYQAKENE